MNPNLYWNISRLRCFLTLLLFWILTYSDYDTIFQQLEGKTPLKPLYLDEWNVRRSERIFLSDSSPQTSPNNTSPGVKQTPADEKEKSKDKRKEKDKERKDSNAHKSKMTKKQKSNNLQDISQKLKKKYSTTFNQKSKEKTSELLKVIVWLISHQYLSFFHSLILRYICIFV